MNNFDFKRYKRFFAFGCSFTNYKWPTWADILANEMSQAEYYNLGLSGGGNLFIAASIAEANQKFKFNEDDFVAVMWTTMCREDRYITDRCGWLMTGNIFTQNEYDEKFVEKFADTRGYLIRDLALISLTSNLLKNLPSGSLMLSGVPFNYQNENNPSIDIILECYSDILAEIKPSLLELEMKMEFTNGHEYYYPAQNGTYKDYHPDPLRYFGYLEKLGLPLSADTKDYALRSFKKLKNCKTEDEIYGMFDCFSKHSASRRKMF